MHHGGRARRSISTHRLSFAPLSAGFAAGPERGDSRLDFDPPLSSSRTRGREGEPELVAHQLEALAGGEILAAVGPHERSARRPSPTRASPQPSVVVGSHAHVLVGAGMKGKALVAYGLGNFVLCASRAETTESGVLEVTVTGRRIDDYRGCLRASPEGSRTPVGKTREHRRPASRAKLVDEVPEQWRGTTGPPQSPADRRRSALSRLDGR